MTTIGIAFIATVVSGDDDASITSTAPTNYVGSDQCATCHEEETRLWLQSDHALAMAEANPHSVLADFTDQILGSAGSMTIDSQVFQDENGRYMISIENEVGIAQTYEIKYTFGLRPLQQFLVETDRGRLQALPYAWDTEQQQWFHLYENTPIEPGEWLHWTQSAMNWNYMCAECHSTNLQKYYDLETDSYNTTWDEITVGCESCHGPGDAHVQWANEGGRDHSKNSNLLMTGSDSASLQLNTCAPCHSRRTQIKAGFRPGDQFDDFYALELLQPHLYHADGQIKDEVYVYGSFLQSEMYRTGMRCTDCHDSHSGKIRHQGNRLCTECHQPDQYDVPSHLHHKTGSDGAQCVNCHMRNETYMTVDPRRDHSFRVPRPDLTLTLDSPNACNDCHLPDNGEDAQWATDQIKVWTQDSQPNNLINSNEPTNSAVSHNPHYGELLSAARNGTPDAIIGLQTIINNPHNFGPIVRATAVDILSNYAGSQDAILLCQTALQDPNPTVRAAAVRSTAFLAGGVPLVQLLRPSLNDTSRLVRLEAVTSLAPWLNLVLQIPEHNIINDNDHIQATPEEINAIWSKAYNLALEEYEDSQYLAAEQPAAHLNLSVLYGDLGRPADAKYALETALKINDSYLPAYYNRAMLAYSLGETDNAMLWFNNALNIDPDFAEAHFAIALLIAETDPSRLIDATIHLEKATRLQPANTNYLISYVAFLEQLERYKDAEIAIQQAIDAAPTNPEMYTAMISLMIRRQDLNLANMWLARSEKEFPNLPVWANIRLYIEQLTPQNTPPNTGETPMQVPVVPNTTEQSPTDP